MRWKIKMSPPSIHHRNQLWWTLLWPVVKIEGIFCSSSSFFRFNGPFLQWSAICSCFRWLLRVSIQLYLCCQFDNNQLPTQQGFLLFTAISLLEQDRDFKIGIFFFIHIGFWCILLSPIQTAAAKTIQISNSGLTEGKKIPLSSFYLSRIILRMKYQIVVMGNK